MCVYGELILALLTCRMEKSNVVKMSVTEDKVNFKVEEKKKKIRDKKRNAIHMFCDLLRDSSQDNHDEVNTETSHCSLFIVSFT